MVKTCKTKKYVKKIHYCSDKRYYTSHLSELPNSSDMKKEQSLVLALHGPSGLPQTLQTILNSKTPTKMKKKDICK
jgi:hypothetical protein